MTPRLTPAARRARLGSRHLLAPGARAERTEEVAEALLGLHATDAPAVVLSARARLREPSMADVDRALYEDRSLRRMHCMRRTLFAVPEHLVPVLHHSTTRTVAARERASMLRQLAAHDPSWDAARLEAAEAAALEELTRRGEAGANELTAAVPVLRETITLAPGKPYEATQRIGGWVLRLLAMDGRIRRGRPLGGWTSGQFRYAPAPPMPEVDAGQAQAEVVRRWLATYGPGTAEDVKWWTGWTLRDTRRALAAVGAVPVALEEGEGWVLPGDTGDTEGGGTEGGGESWAALLPGLDPATMGWRHRGFHLDPAHRPLLFDTAGNGGPTVWWNGEIVGAWAQCADGRIVWRLLADRGEEARRAVEAEAERLRVWLGDARFRGGFLTPLARELASGGA